MFIVMLKHLTSFSCENYFDLATIATKGFVILSSQMLLLNREIT